MAKCEIPIQDKLTLSVDEAASYSGIGENRLRKIIDDNDKTLNWVLCIGGHVKIKRRQFELWVEEQNYL